MKLTAIVGGGPESYLPDLSQYQSTVSMWIGADQGALSLIRCGINPDIAVGDFDSISEQEKETVQSAATDFQEYTSEKDETDLELAIIQALKQDPDVIYLFGVTGGRLDHELANLQLLYLLKQHQVEGVIIDVDNEARLAFPGTYSVLKNTRYPYVSFLPFSSHVEGLTLEGFHYPLKETTIRWGSTLCISNQVDGNKGTVSFKTGILYMIKSRDPVRKKTEE